ncbi:terminase [Pseudomonas sp.]|uniref:terminase n=1 Tax=Pseudomonas sp. TaxID=306 RepID=UPI003D0C9BD3
MGNDRPSPHERETYRQRHQHPTNLLLHLLAVPLFILSCLVLLTGLVQWSFVALVTGVIGLVASVVLQRRGHAHEDDAGNPPDLKTLLVEQFVTFPRFVLSGEWWRAWRNRRK